MVNINSINYYFENFNPSKLKLAMNLIKFRLQKYILPDIKMSHIAYIFPHFTQKLKF